MWNVKGSYARLKRVYTRRLFIKIILFVRVFVNNYIRYKAASSRLYSRGLIGDYVTEGQNVTLCS